ncbi:MAG: glycosyltransferase family 1 protein [Acidobacteria bacterium]|nr:glycosyltransferase family 1 protein [Acidobacteriota bacterium]
MTDDVICFSHLRWNFVFQRPQHLLSRCAREHRVFFFEEPMFDASRGWREAGRAAEAPYATVDVDDSGVRVVVPHLCESHRGHEAPALRALLDDLIDRERVQPSVLWYYTPMALHFSGHLEAPAIVYDCMDELSGFSGAPPGLRDAERALMERAGVVFTGGRSLYESKRHLHPNIHPFPSSVDVTHFATARTRVLAEPPDQASIPHPRIGFFGVLDERLDRELVTGIAALRPEWQIVLLGPVVKIDSAVLPRAANIHYLGQKTYGELPRYLAGWDVGMLPFARNEATRYISPTKTPEYLAGGRSVVSTSIADVVHPYGDLGLARIADEPEEFVAAVEAALAENAVERQRSADRLLATMSWDATWQAMSAHIQTLRGKDSASCSIISSLGPGSPAPSWLNVWPPALEKRY